MYKRNQRIMAWIGIICLLLLYAVSIVLGIFGSKKAFPVFIASLLATFFIPTMIYVFQMILKNARSKRFTGAEDPTGDEDSNK